MTRGEADKLDVFMEMFIDFRRDDRAWKSDISERVRTVEVFVAGDDRVEEAITAQGISRRAYLAIAASVMGTVVSMVLWVANLVIG